MSEFIPKLHGNEKTLSKITKLKLKRRHSYSFILARFYLPFYARRSACVWLTRTQHPRCMQEKGYKFHSFEDHNGQLCKP